MGKNKNNPNLDDHHVFHYKRYWEVYAESRRIRHAVIAKGMCRAAHNLLHDEIAPVPPLSYPALQIIAPKMAQRYEDPLRGIDDFCYAVDEANKHKRMRNGEIDLNNFAVESIRSQIPYIKAGMKNDKRVIL